MEISEWQFIANQQANGQFCSINTPLQPLANSPSGSAATYMKNKAGIENRCLLQIRNTNSATIPTPIAPNVWSLTSASTMVLTGIMIICLDEAPRFITTQTTFNILHLPQACSTASQHFNLPPHYETHQLTINISLNTANISSPDFRIWQHLEDHWNGTQLHHLVNISSVPIDQLYKHMISSNGPITPFTSANKSVDDTASIWTLFSHRGIYAMAIRLLIPAGLGIFCCYFFLVLTWQISALTFMIRFYVTYYCGWWCRSSTHLQMWWQGWMAYNNTSWETWHVYEMGTYVDGESTKATSTVKSSSYIWSLDRNSIIQGTQWAHMIYCQT